MRQRKKYELHRGFQQEAPRSLCSSLSGVERSAASVKSRLVLGSGFAFHFEMAVSLLTGRRRRLIAKSVYLKKKNSLSSEESRQTSQSELIPLSSESFKLDVEKAKLEQLEALLNERLQRKHEQFTMLKQVLQAQKAIAASKLNASSPSAVVSSDMISNSTKPDANSTADLPAFEEFRSLSSPGPPSRHYLMQGTSGRPPMRSHYPHRDRGNRWRPGFRDNFRHGGNRRFRDPPFGKGPRKRPW